MSITIASMSASSVTGNPLIKGDKKIQHSVIVRAKGDLNLWSRGESLDNPLMCDSRHASSSSLPAHQPQESSTHDPRFPRRKRIDDLGNIFYDPIPNITEKAGSKTTVSVATPANKSDEPAETLVHKPGGQDTMAVRPQKSAKKQRKDFNEVQNFKRGSKQEVIDLIQTDAGKHEVLEDLMSNIHSSGSEGQREGLWSTWTDFHRAWFHNESFLPLTVTILYAVSSCFRRGTYRSFSNYLDMARQMHVGEGYEWSDLLKLTARRCSRAVARGQGPAIHAAVFSMVVVASYIDGLVPIHTRCAPIVPGGPAWPFHMLIIGSYFMLREIELASARFEDIVIDPSTKIAT